NGGHAGRVAPAVVLRERLRHISCDMPPPSAHSDPSGLSDALRSELSAALAGRYTIERPIGSGGMATVFLADDLKHHRKVAIKVLHPELSASIGADRFLREIETAARLNHPHILPLYDSGAAGDRLYYVMP